MVEMDKDSLDMRDRMVKLEAQYDFVMTSVAEVHERLIKHMEREEIAFDKLNHSINRLHERMDGMDGDINTAFKERDKSIHELDKRVVKLVAYGASAMMIINVLVQVLLHKGVI